MLATYLSAEEYFPPEKILHRFLIGQYPVQVARL